MRGYSVAVALVLALVMMAGTAAKSAQAAGADILFVVDTSGSMAGTRIADAKIALHTAIASLSDDQPAGLRSYAGACGDGGILRVAIGVGNRDGLRAETDALVASGGTPTPDALRAGAADFSAGSPGVIILISDGQSTCGDPCPVAAGLSATLGVQFKVHAVGFQAPEAAEQELKCIADATGGAYFSADDAEGLSDAIDEAVGGGKMVALGDSYSSGEGTYLYDEHAAAQKCHRGPNAWPRLFERLTPRFDEIEHKACTGAKAPQLLQDYNGNSPQLNPTQPDSGVDLVTLTIGGNDAGFSGIISECFRAGESCADVPQSKDFRTKLTRLTTRLVHETYPAIRASYPRARKILHVGYPQIVPPPGVQPVNCGWLGSDEQAAAIEILARLNFAIQAAAFRTSDVEYVNVTHALSGRELCTADSWVVPVRGVAAVFGSEQGHPTGLGQLAIARTVAAAHG